MKIFGNDYPTPDGTCVRDYIHVTDLARAHLLALDACTPGENRAYNLGSGAGFSNGEVLAVCRATYSPDASARGQLESELLARLRCRRDIGWPFAVRLAVPLLGKLVPGPREMCAKLGAGAYAELPVDANQVCLDRLRAHEELGGDFAVGQPGGGEVRHQLF